MNMRDVAGIAVMALLIVSIKALIEYVNNAPVRKEVKKARAELNARLAKMTPEQRRSADPVRVLGSMVNTMTVACLAATTGKTVRATKAILIRRGITVADYDGAAKKAEIKAKYDD